MIKKTLKYSVVLLIIFLIPITTLNAKTIAQMEQEINATQKKLDDTNVQKAINKQSIDETNKKINTIKSNIEKINSDIDAKTKESEQLEKDIVTKNKETEELMRYYQITSSGSTMLEYIMGAESITDLVYRLAITEQITNYNKKVVKEMNDMIKQNEAIKKDLDQKKNELVKLKDELSTQIIVLNEKQSKLDEEGMSEQETINEIRKQIKYYRSLGCSDNINVSTCLANYYANKGDSNYLPSGTNFFRPTKSGNITSNYGWRTLYNKPNFHAAIDIKMPIGTDVYATAPGYVAKIIDSNKYGGKQVIIWHQINGKYYTSYYAHLSSFNVNIGSIVTKDTVIAKSGNTGNSTGPHLHFGLAHGKWYDFNYYTSYQQFIDNSIDPRSVIPFPAKGSSYYNR